MQNLDSLSVSLSVFLCACLSFVFHSLSVCLSVCLTYPYYHLSLFLSLSLSLTQFDSFFLSFCRSIYLYFFLSLSLSLSLSDGDSTDDVTVDGLELIIWIEYKALPIVTDKIRREKTRHNLNGRDYNLISGRGTHPHGDGDGTGTSWHILC